MAVHEHIPVGYLKSSVIKLSFTCINKEHRMVINKFLTAIAASEGTEGLFLAFVIQNDLSEDNQLEPLDTKRISRQSL